MAHAPHTRLKRLLGSEPRLAERIDVHSFNEIGLRHHNAHRGPVKLASVARCANSSAQRPKPLAVTSSAPISDVDEAQDISVAHLRFFAALGADRPNALFFAGDLGQRIFQQPFSWKSLGVDIRGRSRNLRVNYRTSHQIRQQADRLLGPEMSDVDGNSEDRSDTISVFNGPAPVIRVLKNESEEIKSVGTWLAEQSKAGVLPHELGVFVRSAGQLDRAQAAVKESGLPFKILDSSMVCWPCADYHVISGGTGEPILRTTLVWHCSYLLGAPPHVFQAINRRHRRSTSRTRPEPWAHG